MAGPGDPPAFQLRAPQLLAKQGRRLALQRVALPGYEHRSSQSIAIRERQVKRIRCSIGQAADSRFRFRHSCDFSFRQSPQNVLPRYYAFGASNGLMGFNGVSNVEASRYPSAHYFNRFISARISSRILLWHVRISILLRTARNLPSTRRTQIFEQKQSVYGNRSIRQSHGNPLRMLSQATADLPRRQEQVNVRRRVATFNPTYLALRRRRPQRRFFSVRNLGWSIAVGPQGRVNGRQEVNSHSEF